MATLNIDITPQTKHKLNTALVEEADELMNEIIDFIMSEARENLVKNNTIGATNNLFRKVTVDKSKTLEKTLTFEAPYAEFVEYGTLPHYVNYKHLIDWARKKGGVNEKEAKRFAYFVSRKIGREGMEPHPFLRPAIKKAEKKYGSV